MPLSDPQWYFDTYVDPSYRDYMGDKLERHKGASAIVAVYHFWERLYKYYEENDSPHLSGITNSGEFKKMLISKYPDLGLLRVGTNAIKHQKVKVPSGSTQFPSLVSRAVLSTSSITLVEEDSLVIDGTGGRTVAEVLTSVTT